MIAARDIGGAGTGKTTRAIGILEKAMDRPEVGRNPFVLGFSSFTRAARAEAAGRAAAAWGMDPGELERHGWFKTCHSVAYRTLGVSKGEVIGGSKADDKWLSEALGSDVECAYDDEEEGGIKMYTGDPVAAASLNLWGLARNLVVPLRQVVEAAGHYDPDTPSANEVIKRIALYESAKRLEARIDFTDMLCRFVGLRFDPEIGPEIVEADGELPHSVVGWIFDEAQDASKLLDMACRRLVTGDSCKWAWLLGDPYQVLYSWSGASSEHFMGWDVAKQHIMPKSWRCAPPILALGERCLQRLPDYWDRKIAPADHDGEVVESENFEDDLQDLDPSVETLVIARTNRNVSRIKNILEDLGMPYRRIKAKDGAYNRDLGMAGLWHLQHGEAISGDAWGYILDMLPSKTTDGREWLIRGSKSKWSKGLSSTFDRIYPEDLPLLGATEHLQGAIASGAWSGLPDGGTKWAAAARRWGVDIVGAPKIRVGTIHSAKGMEASKVVMLTSIGRRIRQSEEDDPARFAEERRIEYVGCTRAKHKLIVAHDPRERYRMELPL
jgi:DNA helicase II / ATP-dependent DNA helicase PcrA